MTGVTQGSGLTALDAGSSPAVLTIKSDYCDPRDFNGWDPTGNNDIGSTFQSALAQSITAHVQLRIPKGLYAVGTPIDYGVNTNDGPQIIGVGSRAIGGNVFGLFNHGPDVIFYSTAVDKPCFYNSHGVRGMYMENIQVLGTNIFTQYQPPSDYPQNYNVGQAFRATQYSSHCGIAIDSFNVAVPPDGGYPGMTAKYAGSNQGGSSGIILNNVSVTGFVVGIGSAMSGYTPQGDTWTMRDCSVTMCDSAVVTCSDQAKDAYFFGGQIVNCRQGFDGLNYGAGRGCPILLFGTNLGYLHRIVNYSGSYGPMTLMPNYCESVRSVGNYGAASSAARGHCLVSMGQFTIDNSSSYPPPVVFETYGSASIRDTNFQNAGGGNALAPMQAWNFGNDTNLPIKVDCCTFTGPGTPVNPAIVGLCSTGSVVQIDTCLMESGSPAMPFSDGSVADVSAFTYNNRFMGTVRAGTFGNGTGLVEYISFNTTGVVGIAATATTLVSRSVTFNSIAGNGLSGVLSSNWTDLTGWYMTTFPNSDVRPVLYKNGSTAASWGQWSTASAAGAATAANVALTFTITDASIPQVGDILMWYMVKQYTASTHRAYPAWIITAANSGTGACTAQPLYDATFYDTVANNFGGTNLNFCQRQFAPSGAQVLASMNNSTAITVTGSTTVFQNGDWLTNTTTPASMATNTRVVSGGNTGSLVLNKATTGGALSNQVLHFGTLQQPTLTTVW